MTDTGSAGVGIGLMLGVLAICLSAAYMIANSRCHSQWETGGIAVAVDWGPIQGCMITLKDGTRIPASAYREIK